MKITEQEQDFRKSKIIHCAFSLFCQNGIDDVSMRQIAKEANVGVASVFRYFHSKSDLLLETQKLLWNEIQIDLSSKILNKEYHQLCGFDQIHLFFSSLENLFQCHSNYLLFASQYKSYLVRKHLQIDEQENSFMLAPVKSLVRNALEKGISDHSITIQGDLDSIFYALWGIMRGYIEEIVLYDKMLNGKNHWKEYFPFVKLFVLNSLKHNTNLSNLSVK